jgi:hypothetical protein
MIRSWVRVKVPIENSGDPTQIPSSETITIYKNFINAFSSHWIPFMVCCFVNPTYEGWQILFIQWQSMVDAIIIGILLFVHWRKGAAWWTNISPYIFGFLTFYDYILIPCTMVCMLIITLF